MYVSYKEKNFKQLSHHRGGGTDPADQAAAGPLIISKS